MREDRIKELRSRTGLSQERFAQLLGVSLQTVRRWENGMTKPLPIISLKLEELQRSLLGTKRVVGGIPMATRVREGGEACVEVGLGGLFRGIGNLVDLVSGMVEEGKEEHSASGEIEGLGGKVKGVYGFSIRLGLGGKPVIERFGNIQETEAGPVVTETREPLVDALEEETRVVIVAELPGVEEKDIQAQVQGDILVLSASTANRRYYKELLLPTPVDIASMNSSYRNGILEITLAKP
ncbi:MAG: helix-turn-helix domain-containing protein [Chloroflexi bacterium]|nr:helix-turn-helix domain-containing protein [Chloroflexota bacterium]